MHSEWTKETISSWLRTDSAETLRKLWSHADAVRKEHVGEAVHFRGLIEFSNYCVRDCLYCGLRGSREELQRYRMSADEIVEAALAAYDYGYGTVVLQSGQDHGFSTEWLADIIRRIKNKTPLAVTLSVGERSPQEFREWREAGADRYLLRFETSDNTLYHRVHPHRATDQHTRLDLLRILRNSGYEIGSGCMIGMPGQSYESLAEDLLLFRKLDLDMIGVGPFIAHPDTPLGAQTAPPALEEQDQVPSSELMTYKVIALARLLCPDANIPSTTALATLNKPDGREFGLERGANVVMPNVTPPAYRQNYEIYPAKACITEDAAACRECMKNRIKSIGREVGQGRGDAKRKESHVAPADADIRGNTE